MSQETTTRARELYYGFTSYRFRYIRHIRDDLLTRAIFCIQKDLSVWTKVIEPQIKNGKIHEKHKSDVTPIMIASILYDNDRYKALICRFIMAGCDVNYENKEGKTALSMACMTGNEQIVKGLLTYDAKPTIYTGMGPIHFCVNRSVSNRKKCLNHLISAGVDVNMIDTKYGKTALMFAVENKLMWAIEILLKAGANTKIKNFRGKTIGHHMCNEKTLELFPDLDLTTTDENNVSVAEYLTRNRIGDTGMLFEAMCNIDINNLLHSYFCDDFIILNKMIEMKVDFSQITTQGDTVFDLLCSPKNINWIIQSTNVDVNVKYKQVLKRMIYFRGKFKLFSQLNMGLRYGNGRSLAMELSHRRNNNFNLVRELLLHYPELRNMRDDNGQSIWDEAYLSPRQSMIRRQFLDINTKKIIKIDESHPMF